MALDIFLPLVMFAFVSSITPGPNNIMLMASGVNFGFRRTIPHALGVAGGFVFMMDAIGIALLPIFTLFPIIWEILRWGCAIFLIYLAWRIATASNIHEEKDQGKPLTFVQAALFQWVNPKAVSMAITAISVYAPDLSVSTVIICSLVFGVVNLISVSSWALMGTQMKRFLTNPLRLRVFNITMALLLLLTLWQILGTGADIGDGTILNSS